MIRVLIADDHAVVRRGLAEILEDTEDIVVAAQATGGQEAIVEADKEKVDVVIMDISMPGLNGIEAMRRIKTRLPQLPVVILSIHPEDQYAIRAFKAGASGYLTKESAPEELIDAIRTVAGGRKYVGESLAQQLVDDAGKDPQRPPLHACLSEREHEVLVLFGLGKTVKEIADELSLSMKTVSTYRARIMEKLNLKRQQEILIYAIKNGMVD